MLYFGNFGNQDSFFVRSDAVEPDRDCGPRSMKDCGRFSRSDRTAPTRYKWTTFGPVRQLNNTKEHTHIIFFIIVIVQAIIKILMYPKRNISFWLKLDKIRPKNKKKGPKEL